MRKKPPLSTALKQTGNNKAKPHRLLGIHRTLLYKKMKNMGCPELKPNVSVSKKIHYHWHLSGVDGIPVL
jgi:DNA-binding phage protein